MDELKLFDAEYKLVSIIWEFEPINSTKLDESEALLDGSLPAFLATFLRDRKLSESEAAELRRMIEEAAK